MRILLVQETDWFEKGPLQQNHLMEKLSSRGHQIRVIDHEILWETHRNEGWRSKRQVFSCASKLYDGADITVIRPSIIRVQTLDYISLLFSRRREIARQIREFKPDIILGFQILSPYLAATLAKRAGTPFIYYWTDVYHSQIPFKPYRPLGKYIEKRIIQKSTIVLSINAKLRDYTIKLGAKPALAKILGGTVDFAKFRLDFDVKTLRKQYGIKESEFVLCFVGLFHNQLDLENVLISLAKDSTQKVKLLLVGEGDQHAPNKVKELTALSERLGIRDRVILTGRQSYHEVPKLISISDICILPARVNEMMEHIVPIKMYEYMAMKKPVIATRLPGVMEEFGNDNGVIYVDKPEDIVLKAVELSPNGKVAELGFKARRFVEKHSWDNITDEFERILEELITKKNRSS